VPRRTGSFKFTAATDPAASDGFDGHGRVSYTHVAVTNNYKWKNHFFEMKRDVGMAGNAEGLDIIFPLISFIDCGRFSVHAHCTNPAPPRTH
jgi:hypothetical protein